MYRGTTPTITINCDIDVSEFVTMWVTFRTQQLATYAPPKQVEVTKHLGDEGVDATDKVVTVSLTQADTLLLGSLSPDEDQQVEVQIRGRTEDGRAFASNIMTAPLRWIARLINRPETDGEHCAPSSKEGISLPQLRPSDRPGHG